MVKIAGHQDDIKRLNILSFLEHLNIQCDLEVKKLIREQIDSDGNPSFPFQFNSPIVLDKFNNTLVSTEMIKDEIYVQLAAPYLTKKLNIILMDEIDWRFRKSVIQLLPDSMYIWLSKSFTNFASTAHQLYRQNIVSSLVCRMCNVENEIDIWHVLSCTHQLFSQYRSEVISKLQLKILRLLEDNIFPLYLLE